VIARVIYLTTFVTWLLVLVTHYGHDSRLLLAAGLSATMVLSVALAAIRLRAMPSAARPLIRSRRIALAFGVVYGSLLVAIIVAAVTPATTLSAALTAAGALVIASRFIAYAILRKRRR
jgi:hypothetical protein